MSALTNVSGVNHTKYSAGGLANVIGKEWNDQLLAVYDEYTVPAGDTVAVSTSLYMGVVPKGARIVGFAFSQSGSGAASTGGIKVGSTAVTATTALTDMTSASGQFLVPTGAFAMTPLTEDSVVSILLTSSYDLDAATKVCLTTFYVLS